MNLESNENNEINESNSKALNLESLNTEYKNLLIEYKLAVSNYVNYLKQEVKQPCAEYTEDSKCISPDYNINKPDMTSINGAAFWGTSGLSQNNSQTLEECKASCANTPGCSGATYNLTNGQSKCMLRKGDANIVSGTPNDVAIVPKAQSLLKIVQSVNNRLTQVNEKIQKISQTIETQFNSEAQQRSNSNTNLIDQYKSLVGERFKIQRMLNEYQTLDEQQVQGNIHISQNYYSFILLMLLAILVIFLLYKFSIPSPQSSTTFVQNEGDLGTNAYYIVFGLFLLVLLFTIYNKYKYKLL
jgi:hypothetical protein